MEESYMSYLSDNVIDRGDSSLEHNDLSIDVTESNREIITTKTSATPVRDHSPKTPFMINYR